MILTVFEGFKRQTGVGSKVRPYPYYSVIRWEARLVLTCCACLCLRVCVYFLYVYEGRVLLFYCKVSSLIIAQKGA